MSPLFTGLDGISRWVSRPAKARVLLFFGPAGVERFFRQGGKPAGSRGLPPAGEQFLDKQALTEIAIRYHQEFIGPSAASERLTAARQKP